MPGNSSSTFRCEKGAGNSAHAPGELKLSELPECHGSPVPAPLRTPLACAASHNRQRRPLRMPPVSTRTDPGCAGPAPFRCRFQCPFQCPFRCPFQCCCRRSPAACIAARRRHSRRWPTAQPRPVRSVVVSLLLSPPFKPADPSPRGSAAVGSGSAATFAREVFDPRRS
jgi:hypothetical protein